MTRWHEFLEMGGYGAYVWGAYFAAAAILGWVAIASLVRLRRAERILRDSERRPAP